MSPIISTFGAASARGFGYGLGGGGIGILLNSNLGTTGAGVYYATSTVGGKRVDWFVFDSSASDVQSDLTSKGITANDCYRVTTNFETVLLEGLPIGTDLLCWGGAGRSTVATTGQYGGTARNGGPGGYAKGTLTSRLKKATLIVGQGGIYLNDTNSDFGYSFGGGGYDSSFTYAVRGGGFSAIFDGEIDYSNYRTAPSSNPFGGGLSVASAQSKVVCLAGGGGSSGDNFGNAYVGNYGGGGGGTNGSNGGQTNGGIGGSQSAGGATGGSAFLGGDTIASNQNHGVVCGAGGYYGGGGPQSWGGYTYPGSGGGSGYVSGSYLTSTTNTTATNDQQLPPQTGSSYYFGKHGYANLADTVPQPTTITSSDTPAGYHGMIAIVYPI